MRMDQRIVEAAYAFVDGDPGAAEELRAAVTLHRSVQRVLEPVMTQDGALIGRKGCQPLTRKEQAILHTIAAGQGHYVARDALFQAVWPRDRGTGTHTLETHICRLRIKFAEVAARARIVSERGLGFRLEPIA